MVQAAESENWVLADALFDDIHFPALSEELKVSAKVEKLDTAAAVSMAVQLRFRFSAAYLTSKGVSTAATVSDHRIIPA